jgi:hypothetical protein
MDQLTVYCIDTSSLTHLKYQYPQENFGSLWKACADLVAAKRLIAPRHVLRELEKIDDEDELRAFAKQNGEMFLPLDAEQTAAAAEIVNRFAGLIDTLAPIPQADPYVVALAICTSRRTGARCVVIAEEKPTAYPAPGHPAKIPNVCQAYELQCLPLRKLISAERWSF